MTYGAQFMTCPECGGQAESDAVDVGVGLYIAGNFWCECGWEIGADGMARVGSYEDWFPDAAESASKTAVSFAPSSM